MFFRWADHSKQGSLASRLRRQRMSLLYPILASFPEPVKVLDIGGGPGIWLDNLDFLPKPCAITFLNLEPIDPSSLPGATAVLGDARRLDGFAAGSFDVAFSNSVIEHVGTLYDQMAMAREIRRVGRSYFVQTPNRFFPLEPHALIPGWQFLPVGVRSQIYRRFNVGWMRRQTDWLIARAEVEQIRLLRIAELKRLFPDAEVHLERVGPFVKSLIAIRSMAPTQPK